MTTENDITWLAAILDHARANDLASTIGSVGVRGSGGPSVYVDSIFTRDGGRDAFTRWARSLGATQITEDDGYYRARGPLKDGTCALVSLPVSPNPAARADRVLTLDEFAEATA
ncbi:hypothetical protein [Prauserella endophytica]|uniref:Uncharacterized protein n=1 Tax=Prauserella endophytica TaxID=1592324 RepID=A0ABY2S004_9PSEU|nr:hypothetical protein [Prauserella endophytica]PXY20341.1 hypothetical protein BAY59_31380 [Prauserella coralliicola]TKG66943.1 hypothetical protein FCN18_23825 [Prauserella endophytica]